MALAPSIDNYVHSHKDDVALNVVAKLAITKVILDAEKSSNLFDVNISRGRRDEVQFDFGKIKNSWIVKLWRVLAEDVDKSDVSKMFCGVKFVIFNYDRCIEHFFG